MSCRPPSTAALRRAAGYAFAARSDVQGDRKFQQAQVVTGGQEQVLTSAMNIVSTSAATLGIDLPLKTIDSELTAHGKFS
jgi:hypothetical protein